MHRNLRRQKGQTGHYSSMCETQKFRVMLDSRCEQQLRIIGAGSPVYTLQELFHDGFAMVQVTASWICAVGKEQRTHVTEV
jgi:hypothetical protein